MRNSVGYNYGKLKKGNKVLLISAAVMSLVVCGYIAQDIRAKMSTESDERQAFSAELNSVHAGRLKRHAVSEIVVDRDAVIIQAGDSLICLLDVDKYGATADFVEAAWTKPAGCKDTRFVAMRKPTQPERVQTLLTPTGESVVTGTGETIMAATKAGVRVIVRRTDDGAWRTAAYSVYNWGENAERGGLARTIVDDVEGVLSRSNHHAGAL